jgi:hypothetical protein
VLEITNDRTYDKLRETWHYAIDNNLVLALKKALKYLSTYGAGPGGLHAGKKVVCKLSNDPESFSFRFEIVVNDKSSFRGDLLFDGHLEELEDGKIAPIPIGYTANWNIHT